MSPEDASTLESGEGWSRLILVGDIDIGSVPHLKPLVSTLIAQEPRATLLDLSKVAFLDSSGLGLIAEVARASRTVSGV
ncbi:MAG: STAS domain-containing protein, partial [Actinomycetes bacterium]